MFPHFLAFKKLTSSSLSKLPFTAVSESKDKNEPKKKKKKKTPEDLQYIYIFNFTQNYVRTKNWSILEVAVTWQ